MNELARFWTWSVRGTLDSAQRYGAGVASVGIDVTKNIEPIGRALIVAGILLAITSVVVAIAVIVYYMMTVRRPRVWVPMAAVSTASYVTNWIQRVDDLLHTIEIASGNAATSPMTADWAKHTNVQAMVSDWRALVPAGDSDAKLRLAKDIGGYVRLKDALEKVTNPPPSTCTNPPSKKSRYCADECAAHILDALYAINGYASDDDKKRFQTFVTAFDALTSRTHNGDGGPQEAFGVWRGMKPEEVAAHAYPEEALAYSKSDDDATKIVDELQDALVAMQELAVHCGPILQEMVTVYGKVSEMTPESLHRKDFVMMLEKAPLLVWLQNFGYACKKYWWDGVVCAWEADKKCSRDAFYDTFNLQYANRMWSHLVSIPLQKYSKQLSKRSLVEKYSDPFTAMKRGWEKFERFVRNFFWYIGFFLSNLELTFAMVLMFAISNIVWMLLATLSLPGVRYVAWAIYWYGGAYTTFLYNIAFLTAYIIKAAAATTLEFATRLVSGGYWSAAGEAQCAPQLGTWHARAPGNSHEFRPVGCMLPCPTGFSPDTVSCSKDPAWRPGLCPQQQIHRIARENGRDVGRLATLDGADRYLSASELSAAKKQASTVRMELEAHAKRMDFVENCMIDPGVSRFNAYVRALCMHNATLDSAASSAVCKAAFCTRESASPEADPLCAKLRAVKSDEVENAGRNLALIVLLVAVVVVVICMAILVSLQSFSEL